MSSTRMFLMVFAFCISSVSAHIDVKTRYLDWNQWCDDGEYTTVLKEQYHIWHSKWSYPLKDKMDVFRWQAARLKQKLEVPIAWAHLAFYLSGKVDELEYGGINLLTTDIKNRIDDAQKARKFEMQVLALKVAACIYFNLAFMEQESKMPSGRKLFSLFVKKIRPLFEPRNENDTSKLHEWEKIRGKAVDEIKRLFKHDKQLLKKNKKEAAQNSSVPFPEISLAITCVDKDFFYYWNLAGWYSPGIEVKPYKKKFVFLEEIYKERKYFFYLFLATEINDLFNGEKVSPTNENNSNDDDYL